MASIQKVFEAMKAGAARRYCRPGTATTLAFLKRRDGKIGVTFSPDGGETRRRVMAPADAAAWASTSDGERPWLATFQLAGA